MARRTTICVSVALATSTMACMTDGSPADQVADDDGGETMGEDTSPMTISDPVYPPTHPRIYLTPNRTRLADALAANTPAAAAFKSTVDAWVNGSDIWGFSAWNAALLGQLTGNSTYCTKAVAAI